VPRSKTWSAISALVFEAKLSERYAELYPHSPEIAKQLARLHTFKHLSRWGGTKKVIDGIVSCLEWRGIYPPIATVIAGKVRRLAREFVKGVEYSHWEAELEAILGPETWRLFSADINECVRPIYDALNNLSEGRRRPKTAKKG